MKYRSWYIRVIKTILSTFRVLFFDFYVKNVNYGDLVVHIGEVNVFVKIKIVYNIFLKYFFKLNNNS